MMKRFILAVVATSFTGLMADDSDNDYEQTPEEQFAGVTEHDSNDVADQKKPDVSGQENSSGN